MPANASTFFGFIFVVAEFDILPCEQIYQTVFPEELMGQEPLYPNFELVGIETTLFLYNMGSLLFLISFFPFLVALNTVLKWACLCKTRAMKRFLVKLDKLIYWSKPIITLQESFVALSMSVLINLKGRQSSDADLVRVSLTLTYAFAFLVFSYPIFILGILQKKYNSLNLTQSYNHLFKHLRFTRGRLVVMEPGLYLGRRLLLAASVVVVRSVALQYVAVLGLAMLSFSYTLSVKPYHESRTEAIVQESVYLIVAYCFLLFSDFVDNAPVKA
jgi:hypothetical protein